MDNLDARWAGVLLTLISLVITILIQIGLRIQGAKRAAAAEAEIVSTVRRLEVDYKDLKNQLEASTKEWSNNFRQIITSVAELRGLVSALRGRGNED